MVVLRVCLRVIQIFKMFLLGVCGCVIEIIKMLVLRVCLCVIQMIKISAHEQPGLYLCFLLFCFVCLTQIMRILFNCSLLD